MAGHKKLRYSGSTLQPNATWIWILWGKRNAKNARIGQWPLFHIPFISYYTSYGVADHMKVAFLLITNSLPWSVLAMLVALKFYSLILFNAFEIWKNL